MLAPLLSPRSRSRCVRSSSACSRSSTARSPTSTSSGGRSSPSSRCRSRSSRACSVRGSPGCTSAISSSSSSRPPPTAFATSSQTPSTTRRSSSGSGFPSDASTWTPTGRRSPAGGRPHPGGHLDRARGSAARGARPRSPRSRRSQSWSRRSRPPRAWHSRTRGSTRSARAARDGQGVAGADRAAADEERRRIERDLHDGAQQRLVALALELRSAQRRLGAEADPELDACSRRRRTSSRSRSRSCASSRTASIPAHPHRGSGSRRRARDARCASADSRDRGRHHGALPGRGRGDGLLRRVRGARERRQAREGVAGAVSGGVATTGRLIEVADDGIGGARASGGIGPARARRPRRGARRPAPVESPPAAARASWGRSRARRDRGGLGAPARGARAGARRRRIRGRRRRPATRTSSSRPYAACSPDVAIVDVRMPPTQTDEGARAAREIRAEQPEVGVLLLSQVVEARTRSRSSASGPTASATC